MTQSLRKLLVVLLCLSTASWATEPPRGTIASGLYTYDTLGWTFPIPQQWRLRTKEEIARVRGVGLAALEKHLNAEISDDVETPLLYLQHEARSFCRFTSDAVAYDGRDGNDYEKSVQQEFNALVGAYKTAGLEVSEGRGRVTIDGIAFRTLHVRLYTPDRRRVIGTFMYFDALINGLSLSMGYTVDGEGERTSIHDAVMKSKFRKR